MAGMNLIDKGRPNSKKQICQEEVKEMTKIPKRKANFDNILPRVRQRNMGMDIGFEDSMF